MLGSALRVPVKNNDEDGILKTEERLVKKVIPKRHQVETYRKFHDSEDLRSIAMATQIQEQREKNAILDSFEDGVEQGIKQGVEQGKKEGERLLLNRLMKSKYHQDSSILYPIYYSPVIPYRN